MKKILIASMITLMIGTAFAVVTPSTDDADIVTSKKYVDDNMDELQDKFGTKTADKVATYGATDGAIGEREIKTTLGAESNQADTALTTVDTVNTAVDNKQQKVLPLAPTNVVTYSSTSGTPTTTPIYDSTVNTFDNGLVRAETLNDAVIAGVNSEFTRIDTDPMGPLWRINRGGNRKVLPTTANLDIRQHSDRYCWKSINGLNDEQNTCDQDMYNSLQNGEWAARFYDSTRNQSFYVQGTSVCATTPPSVTDSTGKSIMSAISTEQSALDTAYNDWVSSGRPTTVAGPNCYCKMISPQVGAQYWVFRFSYNPNNVACAKNCANGCANGTDQHPQFRDSLFSAAPVPTE